MTDVNLETGLLLIETTQHGQDDPLCACRMCRIRGHRLWMADSASWLDGWIERPKIHSYRLSINVLFIGGDPVGVEYVYKPEG